MKLLIDTDIGDDIDDALALGYALAKGYDIIGITTVYREAGKRASIAKKMLDYAGRTDIPVYRGHDRVLSTEALTIGRLHYRADEIPEPTNDPDEAVTFIADCAERYGEELCLCAIGPQTNVALAWQRYPEKMKKVGLLAIMGGCFTTHHNEWNIACDPTAARVVAESSMKIFYVPWNITRDICIGRANYDYILDYSENDLAGYLAHLVRQWSGRNNYIPLLHDPATLICAMDPTAYRSAETDFCVLDAGPAAGVTLNISSLNPVAIRPYEKRKRIDLVVETDNDKIVGEFMRTVYKLDRNVTWMKTNLNQEGRQ